MVKVTERWPVPAGLEARLADIRGASIDLTDAEMGKGRRVRDAVIGAVRAVAAGTTDFPILLDGEEFLAGSFGRRTQAQPLDDIDIYFPLDGAALRMEGKTNSPTAEALVTRTAEDAIGCRPSLYEGEWLDSGKVLDAVVERLCPNIPLGVQECGKNARGRCAHLLYDGINVDLVFVLMGKVPGKIDRYHLPTGDSWRWKATNPKEDQRQLSAANQRHDGFLLPVIRSLKAWNDHWLQGRLKSVHLEVLASHHMFGDVKLDGVVAGLTEAFHQLPALLADECPDPTALGDPLDVNLHPDDRKYASDAAADAAHRAVKLNKLAASDLNAATEGWRRILLADGPEAPQRDRPWRPRRHDDEFGQPAHHCGEASSYKRFGVALPRTEDKPVRAPDQSGRSGEFG